MKRKVIFKGRIGVWVQRDTLNDTRLVRNKETVDHNDN